MSEAVSSFFNSKSPSMSKKRAGIGVILVNTINACEYHVYKYNNDNIKISIKELSKLFTIKDFDCHIEYSHDLEHEMSLFSYSSVSNAHLPLNKDYVFRKNKVFNTFFTLKNIDELNLAKKRNITGKTLAVHLRGTDKVGEVTPPTSSQIKNKVSKMLDQYDIDRIFLATDDIRYQTELVKYFGNLVFFETDKKISKNGKAIHFKRNRDRINLEVLKDIYCLSESPYFLYSFSNVSYVALILGINNFQDTGCLNQLDL